MATEYRPAPNAEVGGRNIDPEKHRKISSMTDKHRFCTLAICINCINTVYITITTIIQLFLHRLIQLHPPIAIKKIYI